MPGLIHIYCGNGKGKTTAATGLAVRAAGAGKKVVFTQFFKDGDSSEISILQTIANIRTVHCKTVRGFWKRMDDLQKAKVSEDYTKFLADVIALARDADLLVLDEIISACNHGTITETVVLDFLRSKPKGLEVVLTGRNPSEELLVLADYVSEMQKLNTLMTAALPQEKELNSDMSKILCIIDGMTDPYFCAGDYPSISSMRVLRHVDTTQGQEPESLGCILRLLGTKRIPDHLRGYAEAFGNGIPVNKNDLILRGSWFSLDGQGCCDVPISAPETLPDIEGCHYYHLEQYKSLLVFPGMANFISDIVAILLCVRWSKSPKSMSKGCSIVSRVFHSHLWRIAA